MTFRERDYDIIYGRRIILARYAAIGTAETKCEVKFKNIVEYVKLITLLFFCSSRGQRTPAF